MKKVVLLSLLMLNGILSAQTNPAIISWLINTTGITGRHYVAGNSTPITDAVQANVQLVQYNTTYAYISATGIPAYITGPFQDGNPSLATAQNKIFRIPLAPVQGTGTVATTGGNIGVFKNGVALFDYRDGVAWNNATSALCGGPGNSPCPGDQRLHKLGIEMQFQQNVLVLIVLKRIRLWGIIIITKIQAHSI
ncbi:hypothetical protein [Flavobacterium sp. N1994]|uniref:hypothetical protein n=1 Tax=Flavobacterium sp. N1994 TaxID=2986827 RepID=UPI0022236E35|nr:hypothetical protein [Flavobacterium sp. N1994]